MSDMTNNNTGYEPNFILKPADPAKAAEAAAKADASKAEDTAMNAETRNADPEVSKPEQQDRAESPAAEILRAAAARADALKAAAAKIDPEAEPYRRETSEIDDPVFGNGPADSFDNAETVSETKTASDTFQTNSTASDDFFRTDAGFGSSPRANTGNSYSGAGGSYNSSASSYNSGNSRFRSSGSRPAFENPSFDPGQTGSYTDPRANFRPGASASWTNGEVHRSRKQMKDHIKKQKKASQKVTLTRRGLAFLVAGCMFVSCLFGLGGAALGTALMHDAAADSAQTATTAVSTKDDGSTATSAGYTLESATGSKMTIKEITAAAKNSVVEIRTESVASDSWMQQYVTEGAGSGVIISEDGYIMTNNHVIDGAGKIKVTTADEKEYEAKLVGTDATNDVAVLKIDAKGLTPATYGNSDQLEVGDMAVVIGNPLGELGGTVTAGIISATDRELSIDGKTMHLLQTDGSINPGNSGGGLFNGSGQLVGLVVAKSARSDVEGLGFAIPINTAADVAQQLIDKGYVSGQPFTGMTYQEGTSGGDTYNSFDSLFGGSTSGVYIYSVNGKNAKKAGFQPGDQVYAVDGQEITTFDELSSIITSHKVGDKLTFTIIRDGTQKNIKLELEEKTEADQNAAQGQDNAQGGQTPQTPEDGQNGQQVPDQGDDGTGGFGNWQDWFNNFF